MKKIGVIGEGKMGTNIFYYLTAFDYNLRWLVSGDADVPGLEKTFRKKIRRMVDTEILTAKRHDLLEKETVITDEIVRLGDCDLVIEAVSENLKLKQTIFTQLDQVTSERCILSTNSSSILPSDLAIEGNRRERITGLHFFYPVALKNIVEFIRLPETSADTITRVTKFLKTISRNFIMLEQENAFLLNRLFLDLQNEGFSIVMEGKATMQQVDRFVQMYITPAGIFEFCDHVGNDVMLASVINYIKYEKNQSRYVPFMLELDNLVKSGRLGKKSGQGFYRYNGSHAATGSPAGELDHASVRRLHLALEKSILKHSASTGMHREKIEELLKEYF